MKINFAFDFGTVVNLVVALLVVWRVTDQVRHSLKDAWKAAGRGEPFRLATGTGITNLAFWVMTGLGISYMPRTLYYIGRTFLEFSRDSHSWLIVWSQPFVSGLTFLAVDVIFRQDRLIAEKDEIIAEKDIEIMELKGRLYGSGD